MMNNEIKVNDGNGLLDNAGLCDSLVNDCNNIVKQACSGQYVQFCLTIVQMVQKLSNLKTATKAELDSKDEIIHDLQRLNKELAEKGG